MQEEIGLSGWNVWAKKSPLARFPEVEPGQLSIRKWGSALTPAVDFDRQGQAILLTTGRGHRPVAPTSPPAPTSRPMP